jgi:hypothetical protein
VGFDIILELIRVELSRVWPRSDDGQRWLHKHDDVEIYWGGPIDSEPGFAQELASQARTAGLSVMVNDVIGRVHIEPESLVGQPSDDQSQPMKMHITRRAAITVWFRDVFDDCRLTSETLPGELETFFGVPADGYRSTSLQVTMAIGAMCYSSLFIGPILGDHIDDEMQRTWMPILAEAARISGLPNATVQGIWDRYVEIGLTVTRAREAGQHGGDAAAAIVTSWMTECLPRGAVEPRLAEIQEWIGQEVSAYLGGYASTYWSDFIDEHTLIDA